MAMMVDMFAYIGGIFAMVSFVPQIVKAIKTHSTKDLSWLMLLSISASNVSYQIYVMILWLPPVIITNGVFTATVTFTIILKWRFDAPANK
jgi:MtN3 and saliva related transmembrane protein